MPGEDPPFRADKPSAARIYDYLLGGKDNFAADREAARNLTEANPDVPDMVRENRAFIIRAAGWAASRGIARYLDLGCGLPTEPSVPGTVREVIPDAVVAGVDTDPVVMSHRRALSGPGNGYIPVTGDLRDPDAVLAAVQAAGFGFGEPVCLIMGLVLPFMDREQARTVTRAYADALAPGSVIAASVGTAGDATARRVQAAMPVATWNHTAADLAWFLSGLELVPPGACDARKWLGPWDPRMAQRPETVNAAVAVKPSLTPRPPRL